MASSMAPSSISANQASRSPSSCCGRGRGKTCTSRQHEAPPGMYHRDSNNTNVMRLPEVGTRNACRRARVREQLTQKMSTLDPNSSSVHNGEKRTTKKNCVTTIKKRQLLLAQRVCTTLNIVDPTLLTRELTLNDKDVHATSTFHTKFPLVSKYPMSRSLRRLNGSIGSPASFVCAPKARRAKRQMVHSSQAGVWRLRGSRELLMKHEKSRYRRMDNRRRGRQTLSRLCTLSHGRTRSSILRNI